MQVYINSTYIGSCDREDLDTLLDSVGLDSTSMDLDEPEVDGKVRYDIETQHPSLTDRERNFI